MVYYFSKESKKILSTVDGRLQTLFNEVIKYFDCKVTDGIRTAEKQKEIFDKNKGLTGCDGYHKISKHQLGLAVDVVPYPVNYEDKKSFYQLAGCVKTIAKQLNIDVVWGGDFKSIIDMPHWELVSD